MDDLNQLDELMACRLDDGRKAVTPCTIVIFGASGDLTIRKLIPALYHLFAEKALPSPMRIVGLLRLVPLVYVAVQRLGAGGVSGRCRLGR